MTATVRPTVTGRELDGVLGTDDVTLTGGTAEFDTKDVGTGKTVTGTEFALAGADKGNYTLSMSTAKAGITPQVDHGQLRGGRQGLRRQP